MLSELFLHLICASFKFGYAGFCFGCAGFRFGCASFCFGRSSFCLVNGYVNFLLQSHIANPRVTVRLVPFYESVDFPSFRGNRLLCCEVFQVIPDGLLGDFAVLVKYIIIFEALVSHFDFRVVDIEILEPVYCPSLFKNVVGADKDDVEFFQVVVFFALEQGVAVAHGLVEASPFGDVVGVFHLQFNIKTANGLAIGAGFLHENVVADALGHWADFDGFLGFGVLEFVNLDAENRLQEGLCDFLVAKDHCEHEPVCDGELFKGNVFCAHFPFYSGNAPAKADRVTLSIL